MTNSMVSKRDKKIDGKQAPTWTSCQREVHDTSSHPSLSLDRDWLDLMP